MVILGEDEIFSIDLNSFSPGDHSLSITAISDNGDQNTARTIVFTVPEAIGILPCGFTTNFIQKLTPSGLMCTSQSQAGVVLISCEASTPLISPSECTLTNMNTEITFPCELLSQAM